MDIAHCSYASCFRTSDSRTEDSNIDPSSSSEFDRSSNSMVLKVDGVLDSGASDWITDDTRQFVFIDYSRPVRLRVADRVLPTPAYRGSLHPNSLSVDDGLYHADITTTLISVGKLEKKGMDVRFAGENSAIYQKPKGGKRVKLTDFQRDPETSLPIVTVSLDAAVPRCAHYASKLAQAKEAAERSRSDGSVESVMTIVEIDDVPLCTPASDDEAWSLLTRKEKDDLRTHWRNGHMYVPGIKVRCPACDIGKSHGIGHKAERPENLKPTKHNEVTAWDHCGPWPTSLDGNEILLSRVDEYSKYTRNYPSRTRCQAPEFLEIDFRREGVPVRVRSDNDPTFKGEDSRWRNMCSKHGVVPTYSAPYEPAMNGTVERWNRTQGGLIRANLYGVDKRVWDHASRYVSYCYNRTVRRSTGKSPYEIKHGRKFASDSWRRFGCLAYSKIHTSIPHEADRYERGIFLGYSEVNSTYLVGVWREDRRTKSGQKFTVVENKTVKFDEEILIANVDHLRVHSRGTYVPFSLPEDLVESEIQPELVDVEPGLQPGPRAPDAGANPPSPKRPAEEDDLSRDPKRRKIVEGGNNREEGGKPEEGGTQPSAEPPVVDDRISTDENGVTRKKRGRPKGSKNKAGSRKPGPKPKTPAKTASVYFTQSFLDQKLGEPKFLDKLDEEHIACTVQVSRREAFEGPDKDKWLEADSLERLKLETFKCWRPLEDGDMTPGVQIIPTAVIYTRKRCGKFKARLVALGNVQKVFGSSEIYSPTISHGANRTLLVESAAAGHYVRQFDISNAFIQSMIPPDEKIICRLPRHWSSDSAGDKVRLMKSLYGLRCAPRKWFDTYRSSLERRGWTMNEREPGLFSKISPSGSRMLLAIYVDDNIISGASVSEIEAEMNEILSEFPGTVVGAKQLDDGTEVRDLLGATLRYNATQRTMSITMPDAISKLLKKFNMEHCKPSRTPCVNTPNPDSKEDTGFPIKSLVGGLQYIAQIARPDISFAVQRVACQTTKCTGQTVRDSKRILAYLKGTLDEGLEYSPKSEANFRSVYSGVASEAGKQLGDTVCFSDSDFAGCSFSLKSTSGSILYRRGTPVAWSARRQSLITTSTCQAEYVAAYDSIQLTTSQGYLDWFLEEGQCPLYMIDNQAALGLAGTSVTGKKSKHIELRYHLVRQHFRDLCYCPTDLNRADPLTKPLPSQKYIHLFHNPHAKDLPVANAVNVVDCDNYLEPTYIQAYSWDVSRLNQKRLSD